ncbi:MAG: N-acetylmuramoyl-L-alanine amidase, partial [Bacteroidota bacterium]|nr:N-acetylmuramoyl-L-alanine amidase [Bacteroidota bacterium]
VLTMFLGFAGKSDAQQTYKVRKVVLDAGHGGKDPGCHGTATREKEVALAITLELGRKIKAAYPDVQVIYTREKDVFIALNERAAIANRNKADLFISIHCNYIGARNRATGTETYVLGLHRAEDNLDVAKRENASILLEDDFEKTYDGFDPYSAEGHIILSMFQNAHLQQSIVLANSVESAFKKLAHIPSRGVKQAGFLVLRETTMPSILIETGFLSSDADENYLMKDENQIKVADAIFKAFGNYKKQVEYQQAELAEQAKEAEVKPVEELKSPVKTETKPVVASTASSTNAAKKDPPKSAEAVKTIGKSEYRIQVAASSMPNVDARHSVLTDLEVIREGDLYKFIVGHFSTYEAAKPRLEALRTNGFSGCFIVMYQDGQRVKA